MSAAPVDTEERLDQPTEASGDAGAATAAPAPGAEDGTPAQEDLVTALAQRDEYLEALQRLQAEYDNYRRRMHRELAAARDRGGREVAERVLETLDAFDAAVSHGVDALVPLRRSLLDALEGAGLQRLEPTGAVFDPAEQHAVAHDRADDADQPAAATVLDVLRPGYRWKDRLLRPALVHVKG
jgi:molecular chaperone GrpE